METSVRLASVRQDFHAIDSIARIMIRGTPSQRISGHQALSMIANLSGRMSEASREDRNALRIQRERGQLSQPEAEMLAELGDIQRMADYSNDPKSVARRLQSLWEQNLTFTAQRRPLLRRHRDFAPLFAQLGDSSAFTVTFTKTSYSSQSQRSTAPGYKRPLLFVNQNLVVMAGSTKASYT